MLIFSSREFDSRTAMLAQAQQWAAPAPAAAPTAHPRAQAVCQPPPTLPAQTALAPWQMVQMDCDVDDAESMDELLPMFQKARPLLLCLHGHSSTPAAFFERCDRLQALYGLEIVRFSWSSKKHLPSGGPCCAVAAGIDASLQQELARLFGSPSDWPSTRCAVPLYPVAGDLDNLTGAWWLLMALTGVRH